MLSSCYEIADTVVAVFVIHFIQKWHKPACIGVGLLVAGIGSIVFCLPHFLSGPYLIDEGLSIDGINITNYNSSISTKTKTNSININNNYEFSNFQNFTYPNGTINLNSYDNSCPQSVLKTCKQQVSREFSQNKNVHINRTNTTRLSDDNDGSLSTKFDEQKDENDNLYVALLGFLFGLAC